MVGDEGRREMEGNPVEVGMTGRASERRDALPESSEMKGTGQAQAVALSDNRRLDSLDLNTAQWQTPGRPSKRGAGDTR